MTNHSEWCIKEPGNNCVNCCPACSNYDETKESEDEMSDTPRTDHEEQVTIGLFGHGSTVPVEFARDIERELSTMTAERDALKAIADSSEIEPVYYGKSCSDCKHENAEANKDPCRTCLDKADSGLPYHSFEPKEVAE